MCKLDENISMFDLPFCVLVKYLKLLRGLVEYLILVLVDRIDEPILVKSNKVRVYNTRNIFHLESFEQLSA